MSKYIRKPVPFDHQLRQLQVRGLNRTPNPDDRLLASVDEGSIMSPHHPDLDNHLSSVLSSPSSSGRSSPSAGTNTLTPSQGGWTTGNTTDRSSLSSSYSWDEFDRQAARTVNRHFDEIERTLFEESSSEKASGINKECQEWSTFFPHLRILGVQKIEPTDVGYHEYPRDSPRNATPGGLLLDVTDEDGLTSEFKGLMGRGMKPTKAPVDVMAQHLDNNSEYAHLYEEVFEQEGNYEEIIAIDYKDIQEESENKKQFIRGRRRVGYPPITPNACVKDSVSSSVFDCIWSEIITWMRPLVKEYSSYLSDSKVDTIATPGFRMSHLHDQGPSTRESSYLGMHPKGISPFPLTRANTIAATTDTNGSMEGLLKIASMPLNSKTRGVHESVESSTTFSSRRPPSNKQPRAGRQGKLAPIMNRSQTPMSEVISLQVKRINFPDKTSMYDRHNALPPLSHDLQHDKVAKRKNSSGRASSAIDNKDGSNWNSQGDRHPSETRPSTTHELRSRTPQGTIHGGWRSSTPLGYSSRGSHYAGSKSLGITGSSIQHTSELSHPYPNIMEDEGMEETATHAQWPLKARTRPTVRT